MKNLFYALAVSGMLSVACSCGSGDGSLGMMPESSGRSGEVLLVMPQGMYEGAIGDTVTSWLRQEYLVLNQYEPTLKVIHVKPSAYNEMFRKTRNVIICDINSDNNKSEFRVESDKYARPQVYITLKAPNDSLFLKSWYNVEQYVLDTIVAAEQARYLYGFNKYRSTQTEINLREGHNIDMVVPTSGFKMDVDSAHFSWISRETAVSSQGILLFDFPYNGPQDFDMQTMIRRMDSVLMLNVPGPANGSYMAIEKRVPPMKKDRSRDGSYLMEMRGLWETEGDFMGGPFVSQSIVDTLNNRMVTAFAYVYGGKNDKKNLIWPLEAILSTFKIYYPVIAMPQKD